MTDPTGNCDECGGPVYTSGRFCRPLHRTRYHARRQPEGRIAGIRTLVSGRVRVMIWFEPGELSHLLKREFLPGQDVKIISTNEKDRA